MLSRRRSNQLGSSEAQQMLVGPNETADQALDRRIVEELVADRNRRSQPTPPDRGLRRLRAAEDLQPVPTQGSGSQPSAPVPPENLGTQVSPTSVAGPVQAVALAAQSLGLLPGRAGVPGGDDVEHQRGQGLLGASLQGQGQGVQQGQGLLGPLLRGDGREEREGQDWMARRMAEIEDRRNRSGVSPGGGEGGIAQGNPFWSPEARQAMIQSLGANAEEANRMSMEMEVEAVRQRCLREAEEAFQREVMKLAGMDGGSTSYYSVESGGVDPPKPPVAPPPPPLPPAPPAAPIPPPGLGEDATARGVSSLTEALRNLELPALPSPGVEGAALQFGDWMTVIFPLMCDISSSAKGWWLIITEEVERLYVRWLKSTPLEKLRLKPDSPKEALGYSRVEQRGVSMLLAALPEQLRRDVIAARGLSSTAILFRLHVTYQPGGSAERGTLLKSLSDVKVSGGVHDALAAIRLWRRWLGRAEELQLVLPDGLVLMQVLSKFAEALAKHGGSQVSYRISSVRQELSLDQLPTLSGVREFAEYLQAEAEDLALAQGPAKVSAAAVGGGTQISGGAGNVAVKAVAFSGDHGASSGRGGDQSKKSPCKF